MYTLETLEQTLKDMGKTNFLDHHLSVKPLLPYVLKSLKPEDEILACCLQCQKNLKPGIVIILQDRILFAEKTFFIRKQTEIYLNNIASFQNMEYHIPMASYSLCNITITDNGGMIHRFTNIMDYQAARIIKVLNDKVKVAK